MASSTDRSGRSARLSGFLRTVLGGRRKIASRADARLFIEAVTSHESPTICVESLIASHHGTDTIKCSVRADLSQAFLKTQTLPFIQFLSAPDIKVLAAGQILRHIVLAVVVPPTLWNRLLRHFLDGEIEDQHLLPLAWIVHEVGGLASSLDFDIVTDLESVISCGRFLQAKDHKFRELSYKIDKILQLKKGVALACPEGVDPSFTPGGRHDNDYADFRQIKIYPTNDELLSTARPFYQRADDIFKLNVEDRASAHLDNQFRLLREDMLAEMRQDMQIALGKKMDRRLPTVLKVLTPIGLELGDEKKGKMTTLALACGEGLRELRGRSAHERKEFLDRHKNYLKHQAIGAFVYRDEICAFASLERNVEQLCQSGIPIVCLRFADSSSLGRVLLLLKLNINAQFTLIGTAVFSHEPVLNQLKEMGELPLENSLDYASELKLKYAAKGNVNLGGFEVEQSQIDSLINGITQPLSVVQGPPGTGKSFIGAQIVKCFHEYSSLKILVISYTNHALDQFLEDLLDAGIPPEAMVRLGSKSTVRTLPLMLSKQDNRRWYSPGSFALIDQLKAKQSELREEIQLLFGLYETTAPTFGQLLEHLEFSEHGRRFHDAFSMPKREDDWKQVGSKGREVAPDYLYSRWMQGQGPGPFNRTTPPACRSVWQMDRHQRQEQYSKWVVEMTKEHIERIEALVHRFDKNQEELIGLFSQGQTKTLQSKRIIACTTTAAAMYQKTIRNASPALVLVEEAGEILESHVLTALSPSVKQLILIGDHKQLRPRYNNYALTVEKGDGYNFNMSLFERLIRQGCKYTTLRKQHRMHQEISRFPRALTYPELLDGPGTLERPKIRGLQDRVMFIHHEHHETLLANVVDKKDPEVKTTKQNKFEAQMCLRLVRYLAQQGYTTAQMVVLTPYVGQLRLLMDIMAEENDPILNDLDTALLLQAGLMTHAAAKLGKSQLRLSTVDNYQGEESDIVIGSLTRSNANGDIGFMAAPERLNVLITRARDCLILIGNMNTFMSSFKGTSTWTPFFELLKERNHLYDGFPVKCERHPDKTATLKEPINFDTCCPDGGCAEPCGVQLTCGLHICKRRCHPIRDHSKIDCTEQVKKTCKRGHQRKLWCSKQEGACQKCAEEDKERERVIRRDLKLEEERLTRHKAYAQELQAIQDEITHTRRVMKFLDEEEEQKKTLAQQGGDLRALKTTLGRKQDQKSVAEKQAETKKNESVQQVAQEGKDDGIATKATAGPSNAQVDWDYRKQFQGAKSEPVDKLMQMIGLEEVKQVFLDTKSMVDTKVRQDVSIHGERFSCSLLGNPGTGKTTVARLYAEFLTSVGVIPGSRFEETTGAKLANVGVSGRQKLVEKMLNDGGGVIFVDEAYQLTSGNNQGGGGVLDYLLAEVENLTGKIVFVLAGYNKQMESFFAHNPGLPSRFPIEMKFADYTDEELLRILGGKIEKKYGGSMKCEDGLQGLCCRIVVRRIGKGRGREGFGNARAVENTLDRIARRQASRLTQERRSGKMPDDLLLTKEDLIGPEPAVAKSKSSGWKKLSELTGLRSVKEAVQSLVDTVQQNYLRELAEQATIEYSLNKVFLGNPGTGKTTVAKLYGQILVELGLLSKGEVVVKNPSDFVGSVIGESEKLTKGILASTSGKVLVIDEAYGLYNAGGSNDQYKTAVIDTIVAEVQSVPGEDRCVLLLGYRDQMEAMFQNVNPGLTRRFPIAFAFEFEDFNDDELMKILDFKLTRQSYRATDEAKRVVSEMLNRARNRPNFGNAGEIDIILDATKARHQGRVSKGQARQADLLEARDFDEDFDRAERSDTKVRKLFESTVGAEEIVSKLEGYQETVRTMKALGLDAKETIPFNFVFSGPPGTGKTTTARKMGKVFYDMGFLATAGVIDCSASDLVGQYVGQTGHKVIQQLDKALGRVLFIDEAYRLAQGPFAKEAIDELVDCVTKPRYFKKLIIILAGYKADINRLLAVNEGLTSRFPEMIDFRSLQSTECVSLLQQTLASQKRKVEAKKVSFDLSILESPERDFSNRLNELFTLLSEQASWANARDVQTVGKSIFVEMLKCKEDGAAKKYVVRKQTVLGALEALLKERADRASIQTPTPMEQLLQTLPERSKAAYGYVTHEAPSIARETKCDIDVGADKPSDGDGEASGPGSRYNVQRARAAAGSDGTAKRDAGVSDAVWEQLQRDRRAEQEREDEIARLQAARDQADEAEREIIIRRLIEEERRRQEEAAMRARLAVMGICPAGFQWIRQSAGYRCAGGSHFLSDEQLMALSAAG